MPAIVSVTPTHRSKGLLVVATMACGHTVRCEFPDAPRRSSRQEIRGWIFGSRPEQEVCYSCRRSAQS